MFGRQMALLIAVFSIVSFLFLKGCVPLSQTKSDVSSGSSSAMMQPAVDDEQNSSVAGTALEALRSGRALISGPLESIYFEFDQYDLRAEAREALKANAHWMMENPAARVEIEGHCDERGTNEYNLALGNQRARAALDYLVTLGVSPKRFSTVSYGEEVPVCREKNEECWQKNRHARFVVLPDEPAS
jgi:peptidoglycan-associated lipoprotein